MFDGIAFVHLLKLPLAEPERMPSAREHLLEVVRLSRRSWAAIEAETDDDREWIPNPDQSDTAIPGARVAGDMIAGWRRMLDELEAILEGRKLAPFWRGPRDDNRGVNVKRVFTEPREFDLVMWIQGSAAAPYLEEGEITDRDLWRRIQRNFRGQFFWFAIWVN